MNSDDSPDTACDPAATRASDMPRQVYRHRVASRLWHWTNAVAAIVLLGSGLTISNAHPHLYWGQYGANYDTPWLSLPHFPGWITLPATYDLARARDWHLTFALVLAFGLAAFLAASLWNRHLQTDLRLRACELTPTRLWEDVRAHAALRFHDPDRPGAYNLLQKLAYIVVIVGLLPLLILTGLTLSPGSNAAVPWLLDLFGGRASARSIHFVVAALLAGFVVVHLALVILAGVGNEVRSMLTGWWRVPRDPA